MLAVAQPVIPATTNATLSVKAGRDFARLSLQQIQQQANAPSFRITKCSRVGKTVVCTFAMRMRNGETCAGRVQVRIYHGDPQRRFVGVKCGKP